MSDDLTTKEFQAAVKQLSHLLEAVNEATAKGQLAFTLCVANKSSGHFVTVSNQTGVAANEMLKEAVRGAKDPDKYKSVDSFGEQEP